MKIESEHNGIKFGDKCWAWNDFEKAGREFTFTAYLEGTGYSVKGFNDDGYVEEFRHARPLKTEAEKVLEAFEWKKIWSEKRRGSCKYYIPQSIVDDGRLECLRSDGLTVCFSVEDFDDWQLWEAPEVTLDTRRVAGWWCTWGSQTSIEFCDRVSSNGDWLEARDLTFRTSGSDTKTIKFSKDPMKPLDEWQTLAEICAEAQA